MKSRIEERFMTATFGPEYDEYRRTTEGIVPRSGF
jgi:protein-S-isoprenylcysteine O-methyltransferase Ste14